MGDGSVKMADGSVMPSNLAQGIERLSGVSMDDVRVHYNSLKPVGLGALAYTEGNDIHLAPGAERHLPHEAWHVVQQAQGRVSPAMGVPGEAFAAQEAQRLAVRANNVAAPL
jgi:hypothetical protein